MGEWHPAAISADLAAQIRIYRQGQRNAPNLSRHSDADKILSALISVAAPQIIDREGLPHIAHLIYGWGNAKIRNARLFDCVADFAVFEHGKPFIPQNYHTGDFHPWQTFAYCVMSDRSALHKTTGGVSLALLAGNSSDLNTSDYLSSRSSSEDA